ncbi:MAG: polymer-forming cytoskeletal protein [Pseudomonadales bacterium]|nr:polymer-forming cytoskeletal protein [Pseudomonadales bacterium]
MFGSKDNKDSGVKAPTSFSQDSQSVIPKKITESKKSSSTTLIAKDAEIFGDIKFAGNLEIEGHVVGNLIANPGSDASVRVMENGTIEGDLNVPNTIINGLVKGNVHANSLELANKAKVEGNVHYQSIEMVKGSQVNGSLVYTDASPAAKTVKIDQHKSSQS